jgi:hypothetical protein
MKKTQLALCLSLTALAVSSVAKAETGVYATASMAQTSCGSEPVVWIDLDRGRYYKLGQVETAKTTNGVYACERTAHAKYREGKVETTAVAKQ